MKIDLAPIMSCANSDKGNLLEHEMALKYAAGRCAKVVDTASVLAALHAEIVR